MTVTQEMIAAFADGELSGDERRQVEEAIAADPALARKVESHRALRGQLAGHYAPILEAKVPDHLVAMLADKTGTPADRESAEVVSFAAERQKRGLAPMIRRFAPIAGPALAASLVLALWQPWQGTSPAGYADPALAEALDTQLAANQPASAPTRMLLSFENGSGELCRAYSAAETGGIACRDDSGWRIDARITGSGAQDTQFRQAGSEAELFAAVQEMAAGAALDADAEAAAKAKGWQP
jgi:hypothetical protein